MSALIKIPTFLICLELAQIKNSPFNFEIKPENDYFVNSNKILDENRNFFKDI
jgi:hypothetical protein